MPSQEDDLCIIMEYADGGDLAKVPRAPSRRPARDSSRRAQFIKDARPNLLREDKVLDIFAQACR